MIDTAIYLLLTVFVPLRQTYNSIKDKDPEDTQLWSIYWAVFAIIKSLQFAITFFEAVPFQFLFLLILIWLYHEHFKVIYHLCRVLYLFEIRLRILLREIKPSEILLT